VGLYQKDMKSLGLSQEDEQCRRIHGEGKLMGTTNWPRFTWRNGR